MVNKVPGYEDDKVIDYYQQIDGKIWIKYLNQKDMVLSDKTKEELDLEMTNQAKAYVKQHAFGIQVIEAIIFFALLFVIFKCGVNVLNDISLLKITTTFKFKSLLPIIYSLAVGVASGITCHILKKAVIKKDFDVHNKEKYLEYFEYKENYDEQNNSKVVPNIEINKVQDYSIEELRAIRTKLEIYNDNTKSKEKVLVKK